MHSRGEKDVDDDADADDDAGSGDSTTSSIADKVALHCTVKRWKGQEKKK